MLRLSLLLLGCLSCAPASTPAREEPNALTLVLFAAPGLELGDELRAALIADHDLQPLLQERDVHDPLFRAAVGSQGQLGLGGIDQAPSVGSASTPSDLDDFEQTTDARAI